MSAILTATGAANQYYNPGTRWTSLGSTSGLVFNPLAAVYNGSIWCAVGNTGRFATSSNYSTWTSGTNGAVDAVYDIAWNGSVFCAVYNFAYVYTSPDGSTWTQQTGLRTAWGTLATTNTKIVWTGTYFVALSSSGRVARSTDGVTWTSYSTLSSTSWASNSCGALFWSGSNLYAATLGGGGTAISTDQGATWTYSSSLGSVLSGYVKAPTDIMYVGGRYLLFGSAYTGSRTYYVLFATSNDGATWTDSSFATSTLSWSSNIEIERAATDGRKIIILGADYSTATSPRCAISFNGGNTWVNNSYYASLASNCQSGTNSILESARYANNAFYSLTNAPSSPPLTVSPVALISTR